MTIRAYTVVVDDDVYGDGEGFSPYLTGYVKSIRYVKEDYEDGVDFTIVAEATGETLWTQGNVNADAIVYPRAATHGVDGVEALNADESSDGEPVGDLIALGRDRVWISVASAAVGTPTTGTFIITTTDRP